VKELGEGVAQLALRARGIESDPLAVLGQTEAPHPMVFDRQSNTRQGRPRVSDRLRGGTMRGRRPGRHCWLTGGGRPPGGTPLGGWPAIRGTPYPVPPMCSPSPPRRVRLSCPGLLLTPTTPLVDFHCPPPLDIGLALEACGVSRWVRPSRRWNPRGEQYPCGREDTSAV